MIILKKQFILFIFLLIFYVFKVQADDSWTKKKLDNNEESLFKVQILESNSQKISEALVISSTTEALRKISVKSELTSKIENVILGKGSVVKKDDLVLKLEEYDSFKKLYSKDLISKNEFNKIALLAPFEGIILDGHKITGELLSPGEIAYEIIDLSKVKSKGYINEKEIAGITNKNKTQIKILDRIVDAKIDYISPVADKETKTFEITVILENPDVIFKDGMSSEITIFKDKINVHKISPSVLTLNEFGDMGVKVLDESNIVVFKKIKIMNDTSEFMLISGLDYKENIIIVGQQYVTAGDKVSPQTN